MTACASIWAAVARRAREVVGFIVAIEDGNRGGGLAEWAGEKGCGTEMSAARDSWELAKSYTSTIIPCTASRKNNIEGRQGGGSASAAGCLAKNRKELGRPRDLGLRHCCCGNCTQSRVSGDNVWISKAGLNGCYVSPSYYNGATSLCRLG